MIADESVLWRRFDQSGHEAARLSRLDAGWQLAGAAVFASDGKPCQLDYTIECDLSWRTRSARVTGWLGSDEIDIRIAVVDGRWLLNGVEVPAVAGCVDLDLNFSPSTNLLPIRRLGLTVGASASVAAAWLRFPSFTLERLDQIYRRTGESTYHYESAGGRFAADLTVNPAGFVTKYADYWETESSATDKKINDW